MRLEDLRIVRGWTFIWATIIASATVHQLIEHCTCALASEHAPIRCFYVQLCWVYRIHVGWTARFLACTRTALWHYRDGQKLYESCPPFTTMLISTKEAGRIAWFPLHATWPEPQSFVAQVNFPDPVMEHRVRAQNWPFHGAGTSSTDLDAFDANSKSNSW